MDKVNKNIRSQELQKALSLWLELTGIDPNQTSFKGTMGELKTTYELQRINTMLQEALELDPTNVMCYFLLDAVSKDYFSERSFSVNELLSNPETTAKYLLKVREFQELVQHEEILSIGDDFIAIMREALTHYHALNENTEKLLADRSCMAFLRRDALRSMENLNVHQFLRGKTEAANIKPAYHQTVHQFWNINSLVQAACGQPSGVR